MRYIDENGNEVLNPDYSKGEGHPDKIFIKHHDAIPAVEEQYHYVVVHQYPNGGKDVEKVIDVPGSPAVDAWDEYEDIIRWRWYTPEEQKEHDKPTQMDIIEAQTMYTAMMTDTLLEG